MSINVLVVDDKKSMRDMLTMMLEEKGYSAYARASGNEALEVFSHEKIDIMITDMKMPQMDGLELLGKVKQISPSTMVIVITAYGSVQDAVNAMKLGALDFIEKPFPIEEMEKKIQQLVEKLNSGQTKQANNQENANCPPRKLVGISDTIRNLYNLIEKIACSNSSILILGESGTGKELVAREIHDYSNRKEKPFVAVNCVALVETLLEDELFGHEKGAFTGAQSLKKGRFEIADGGTLFLDEIADMAVNLQAKLLRVLQEKYFERVGSTDRIEIDVRIIAATNKDIEQLIQDEKFRKDLYYRLNVITIEIPPLRERKQDIRVIAEYYLSKYCKQFNKSIGFTQETIQCLESYHWPGNVRQLQNVIERGIVLAQNSSFTPQELPPEISDRGKPAEIEVKMEKTIAPNISDQLERMEREAIKQILEKNNWNQTKAAKELGLGRTALQYKMKKFGIEK